METTEFREVSENNGLYFISSKKRDGIRTCSLNTTLEYFRTKKICEVDTETTGYFNHHNRILTLQLGDNNYQFVIDFQELTEKEKNRISEEILNNRNIIKIFQNAKFDIKFIWFEGMKICSVYDTMLAECLLNAGREKPEGFLALGSICERYCGVKLNKEIRGQIHREGLSTKVIQYAGDDVKYLSIIREAQMKKLEELQLSNGDCQDIYTVLGLENNAVLAFAMIEYYGIKLDTEKWSKVTELILEKEKEILEQLDQEVFNNPRLSKYCSIYQDLFTAPEMRTTVNWASSQQKLDVLNQIGKFESTKQQELEKVKRTYPLVNLLIQYNKISKLLNSFAIPLPKEINKYTGRIHTDFWQILNTGRVSSSNP